MSSGGSEPMSPELEADILRRFGPHSPEAYAAGFAAGAERMREEAAKVADEGVAHYRPEIDHPKGALRMAAAMNISKALTFCAKNIRDIPIPATIAASKEREG